MTIFASDIDGVLADIAPELHKRISLHFGVPKDEVRKDKYWMSERFNIDPKVMNMFVDTCLSDENFWELVEPIEHNLRALKQLDPWPHRLILITGRHKEVRDVTEEWLVDHGLNYHTVLMNTLSVKHKALKYCGAEFMIEDRYSEAKVIAEQGFRSYLLRTPYTLEYATEENPENLIFVNNVQEVLDLEGIK